jgi:hypothetical protein
LRIPTKPIAASDLMAIMIPRDGDRRRSEATLGSSYHPALHGIRQSFSYSGSVLERGWGTGEGAGV